MVLKLAYPTPPETGDRRLVHHSPVTLRGSSLSFRPRPLKNTHYRAKSGVAASLHSLGFGGSIKTPTALSVLWATAQAWNLTVIGFVLCPRTMRVFSIMDKCLKRIKNVSQLSRFQREWWENLWYLINLLVFRDGSISPRCGRGFDQTPPTPATRPRPPLLSDCLLGFHDSLNSSLLPVMFKIIVGFF